MKGYDFRIQDADDHRVMFPEYTPGEEMTLIGVGLAQGGTVTGKPGVILLVQKEGEQLVHPILMTAAAFLLLAAGMKGAMARWGEPWTGA